MDYFYTNTIWYLLLGIITLIELMVTLYKAENRLKMVAFYMTIFGAVLNVEAVILIFLNSYTYYPMILHNHQFPFHDNLAGNLFSQSSLAATAMLAAVFKLPYYWYAIIALIYGLIEELFLYLGIYSHNWYRTWMTVLLLPVYFWAVKLMYNSIKTRIKPFLYYVYIYLGMFVFNNVLILWFFQLTGIQEFQTNILSDINMSRHLLVWSLFHILTIPLLIVRFAHISKIWKAVIVAAVFLAYFIGYKLNLVLIKDGWFLPVAAINVIWTYLSILLMDWLYKTRADTSRV